MGIEQIRVGIEQTRVGIEQIAMAQRLVELAISNSI